MAKPDEPGKPEKAEKTFTVVHPTEPDSPKQVTQEEWAHEQMASKGWKKAEPEVEHYEG
jgi:hypothetical protein